MSKYAQTKPIRVIPEKYIAKIEGWVERDISFVENAKFHLVTWQKRSNSDRQRKGKKPLTLQKHILITSTSLVLCLYWAMRTIWTGDTPRIIFSHLLISRDTAWDNREQPNQIRMFFIIFFSPFFLLVYRASYRIEIFQRNESCQFAPIAPLFLVKWRKEEGKIGSFHLYETLSIL